MDVESPNGQPPEPLEGLGRSGRVSAQVPGDLAAYMMLLPFQI
eukprot:SAG31_NODE_19002_length_615_cov_0.724806_1_plen_43_part_00